MTKYWIYRSAFGKLLYYSFQPYQSLMYTFNRYHSLVDIGYVWKHKLILFKAV